MAEICRFVLPGAPKGKAVARVTRFGTFIPAASKAEMDAIRMIARMAMAGREPYEGPVELSLCAYCPVPPSWSQAKQRAALAGDIKPTSKPDLSNIIKLAEDAIITPRAKRGKTPLVPQKAVIKDDSQIVKVTAWKIYSQSPRLVVMVAEVGPALSETTSLASLFARPAANQTAA